MEDKIQVQLSKNGKQEKHTVQAKPCEETGLYYPLNPLFETPAKDMYHVFITEVLSSNCIVAHRTLEELVHYCWALPV
jgi:hypothetical protein